MNTRSATHPSLRALEEMQADPFRAAELHRMQEDAATGLRDLTHQLALHLATSTKPRRQDRHRHSMAAGKQREQRARACQALAEEMILQTLIHLHDPQWDPCATLQQPINDAPPSLLLSLLQMAEPAAPLMAQDTRQQQEEDVWMEP